MPSSETGNLVYEVRGDRETRKNQRCPGVWGREEGDGAICRDSASGEGKDSDERLTLLPSALCNLGQALSSQGPWRLICKRGGQGGPVAARRVKNLASICEDAGLIPGLAQWVKDLALLWLWCRLAAVASI